MDEIILLTAGDIHMSDTNPRSRTDNFKETMLGKIEQLRDASKKFRADAVILTGDLYNLKNPVKNSHNLNRELIELFNKFECPVYTIPGNHDLTADDLDTLTAQPLSVLFASGVLKDLSNMSATANINIEKNGLKVSLVGVPYLKDFKIPQLKLPPKDSDCIIQICAMHIYAGPKAGKMHKERLFGYDELGVLSPDIFVLGHYHYDQGIQWLDKKCFINLGSISRGTLTDERIEHVPKFGYIKISREDQQSKVKIDVDSIPLKIKPANDVFDLKKRADEEKQGEDIEKYVAHLVAEASSKEAKTSIEDQMKKMNIEKEIQDTILELIKEARANRK
jgi:DNA repair exonuclease SbcCD nuclease subunit